MRNARQQLAGSLFVIAMVAVLGLTLAAPAEALTDEEREARRIEREARREARRLEREERRAQREAEREARRAEREAEREVKETSCSCRARFKFGRPRLTFVDDTLAFSPSFDVAIKTKGSHEIDWVANLKFAGAALYESADITSPDPTVFSGNRDVAAFSCGSDFKHKGLSPGPLPLAGLVRTLLTGEQTLEGVIGMKATLDIPACDFSEEIQRQFTFDYEAFGNVDAGNWRRSR